MITNANDIHKEIKRRINMGKCMLLFTWKNFIVPPAFYESEKARVQVPVQDRIFLFQFNRLAVVATWITITQQVMGEHSLHFPLNVL